MNPIQLVVTISISTLTICLILLTIWMTKVLKQFKNTIVKTNLILDDAKLITENLNQPLSHIKDLLLGLREGVNFFSSLFKKNGRSD